MGANEKVHGPRSLIDVATPPAGFTFDRGIWFTHDVDFMGATFGVVAALAGEASPDRRRRLHAAASLTGRLDVIAQPGRVTAQPPTSSVQILWGPSGRLQHAKFALLRFRKGKSVLTRAAVGSGNLTWGGLSANIETLLAEETTSGGPLAGALAAAALAYTGIHGLPSSTAEAIVGAISALGVTPKESPAVLSSWTGDGLLAQLSLRPDCQSAQALTIVDPGFSAGAYPRLAKALHSTFPAVNAVRLVAPPLRGDNRVAVAPGLIAGITAEFGFTHELHVVRGERPLHAKVLAWDGPDGKWALVGSANCTANGLLGKNLELGCVVSGGALMKQLPTAPAPNEPDLVTRPEPTVEKQPRLRGSGVVLAGISAGALLDVSVDIEVEGDLLWKSWRVEDAEGRSTVFDAPVLSEGQVFLCKGHVVRLDVDNWVLEVRSGKHVLTVPVNVEGYEPEDLAYSRDVDDPLPATLASLLAGYSAPRSGRRRSANGAARADVLSRPDDSLVHAIANALREQRFEWWPEELSSALEEVERLGRLTTGERWALEALAGTAPGKDHTAKQLAAIAERLGF